MPDYAQLDRDYLWHPFTQQQGWSEEEPLMIERGEGSYLYRHRGPALPRRDASLWCNVHGHRHPVDRRGGARAARPRRPLDDARPLPPRRAELAARLVEIAPEGLSRVFYSDSGSTAAEIALKIAFQYQQQRGGEHARRTKFVRLREAYHGDTIGSVSIGGIDLFHATYRPLLFETHVAEPGDAADLERVLAAHGAEVAAVSSSRWSRARLGSSSSRPATCGPLRELCDRFGVLLSATRSRPGSAAPAPCSLQNRKASPRT